MASPAGLSVRWPSAMAHRMTAEIRCRDLRAISALVCQIGTRAASTSAEVIWSTRLLPRWG